MLAAFTDARNCNAAWTGKQCKWHPLLKTCRVDITLGGPLGLPVNCSQWNDREAELFSGTWEHFDHLILPGPHWWNASATTWRENLVGQMARMFRKWPTAVNQSGGCWSAPDFTPATSIENFWEAEVLSPMYGSGDRSAGDIKMILGLFDELWGTAAGEQLREWCKASGWALVWALGNGWPSPAECGGVADNPSNQRFLDPDTTGTAGWNLSLPIAAGRAAAAAAWAQFSPPNKRPTGNYTALKQAWSELRSALPNVFLVEPLYGLSCADVDCIGIIAGSGDEVAPGIHSGDCVCYKEARHSHDLLDEVELRVKTDDIQLAPKLSHLGAVALVTRHPVPKECLSKENSATASLKTDDQVPTTSSSMLVSGVSALNTHPQVHWQVDAGRAKEGVSQWAAKVASLGAITGLTGCCGRFSIAPNGTFRDNWHEAKYPLSDWNFAHDLNLTMHFVFTVDQKSLLNRTALLAIEPAVRIAVTQNFTGYSLDYETAPAGVPGSILFAKECNGLLEFITRFASALKAEGKELIVDMGGTTAASLSTQVPYQQTLVRRWAATGVTSLMSMETYYGTDLAFNEVALMSSTHFGVPTHMLSSGIGSSTTAGCGCGDTGHGNRSCCALNICCGPAASAWAKNPPFSPNASCVGAPCGHCNTLGTSLPCFNWTADSLRSYATTLARSNVTKISVFMSTMDQVMASVKRYPI